MNEQPLIYEDYSLEEIAEFEQELISLGRHNGVHICEVLEPERDDFDSIPDNYSCIYFPTNSTSEEE